MEKEDAIKILDRQLSRLNKQSVSNYIWLSQTNDYLRQFLPPKAALLRLYHDQFAPLESNDENEVNAYLNKIRDYIEQCKQYINDVGVLGEVGLIKYQLEINRLKMEGSIFKDQKYLAGLVTGLIPTFIEFAKYLITVFHRS